MIHWVYPFNPDAIAAPWSIGNHVAAGLRATGYEVKQYDWQHVGRIEPGPGDILIGHPCREPGTVFVESLGAPWACRVAVSPWNGAPWVQADMDGWIPRLDAYLGICGEYWASRIPENWRGKFRRLDIAIDPRDYPFVKHAFNPPGRRRIVYIGCTVPDKGTDFLERIIAAMPEANFLHAGYGQVAGAANVGHLPRAVTVAHTCDFLIAPGRYDANPTVVLEAMAWGLIPFATPTSGWGAPDVVPILLDDVDRAVETLREWQQKDISELHRLQSQNRNRALEHYTWSSFVRTILTTITGWGGARR